MKIIIMSRAQVKKFSYYPHDEKIAVISISDCDKDYPILNNNKKNGIAHICKFHFDDVEEGGLHCISENDAGHIASFIGRVKDNIDMLIVHCEAGISRSAGVAAAIMKFINDDDTVVFDNPMFHPNMTCYKKVLNAFQENQRG